MKKDISTIAVLAVLTMSGCASDSSKDASLFDKASSSAKGIGAAVSSAFQYENGIYVPQEKLDKIKAGKSDQNAVIALIGHPPQKSQVGNKEVWSYPYTKIPYFGANVNETTVVEFNAKGIVISAYKSGGRVSSTGNPLVDAANGK